MVFGVYSIRDVKTGFMTPTIDQSDQAAARNFQHSVCNSDGILRSFASDFFLYRIGSFDSESGILLPLSLPVLVFHGADALLGGANDAG